MNGYRFLCGILVFLFAGCNSLDAQDSIADRKFYGFIFNARYEPVQSAHIINLSSRAGTISDKLGYFEISSNDGDFLLIKNISYIDTIVRVHSYQAGMLITMTERINPIEEVKIFEWGNSYQEMKTALLEMPEQKTVAQQLGFMPPDPDYLPFFHDEKEVKKFKYFFVSPVSYLYYNLSRRERNIRRAIRYERNQENREYISVLLSRENIAGITGYEGRELDDFLSYLNANFRCDHNCQELEIISEIYFWWNLFKGEG